MLNERGGSMSKTGSQQITAFLDTVWEDLQQGPSNTLNPLIKGLSTGFDELDKLTNGLRAGSLTVIGGRVAIGTTSLALSIAQKVAVAQSKTVVIFSLDFDGEQATRRILSGVSEVDMNRLRSRSLDEDNKARIEVALERLRKTPLYIDDTAIGLPEIRESILALIASGVSPELVVIDDLQTLVPDIEAVERTEIAVRNIKALAQEIGVAVILSTNLPRRLEKRRDRNPKSSDLPSGVITGGADLVLLVYREEYYSPDTSDKGTAKIYVMRNRYGYVGMLELYFRADCCLFEF
ncbi:MAG: AAA family ATPase [Proteobacteria bacterium]|nr:AAA family ATPase [Pseudomonadota bacterium]